MRELGISPVPATLPPKYYIVEVVVQDMEVGLNRSTTCPFSMLDKVLMVLVEVDLGLIPSLLPPIIKVIMVDFFCSYGDNRSVHRSHTRQFSAYNHGGIYISHPRFPKEDIPRGVD